MSTRIKLGYRQLGLFRIISAIVSKGTYVLEELDKTRKSRTVSGTRLKAFVYRGGIYKLEGRGGDKAKLELFQRPGPRNNSQGTTSNKGGEESLGSEESEKNTGIKTTIRGTNSRGKELEEQRGRTRYILEG